MLNNQNYISHGTQTISFVFQKISKSQPQDMSIINSEIYF